MGSDSSISDSFDSDIEGEIKIPQWLMPSLTTARDFSLDIGGSLVKVAFLSKNDSSVNFKLSTSEKQFNNQQSIEEKVNACKLSIHFVKFEARYVETSLDFIQRNLLGNKREHAFIYVTGGGAYKYKELIQKKLGLRVEKRDEMASLVTGSVFVLRNIQFEAFRYEQEAERLYKFVDFTNKNIFPFLLVHIGSGVSIIKVNSDNDYERVGGTSLGGGTFLGLGRLLTPARSFEELIELANAGENSRSDLLVKDIYGGAYDSLKLPGDLIASSFGKAISYCGDNTNFYEANNVEPADIARSLLYMISYSIGQISSLHAQIHSLKNIFFGGYFIRDNSLTMEKITFSVNYFSKNTQNALFLRHDGYLGAIGCLLQKDAVINNYDWAEKLKLRMLSDEVCKYPYLVQDLSTSLICVQKSYEPFPLLSKKTEERLQKPMERKPSLEELQMYCVSDISSISEYDENHYLKGIYKDFDFWGSYLSENISLLLQGEIIRPKNGFPSFPELLRKINPMNFYSVERLFDLKEQYLAEFYIPDPFLKVKTIQNVEALSRLPSLINVVDAITDWQERIFFCVRELFIGNFFDFGSNFFLMKFLNNRQLSPDDIQKDLHVMIHEKRPEIDDWIDMYCENKWKTILFFLDNSGYDLINGALLLAREFLKDSRKVIMVANTYCAINDVMFSELTLSIDRVSGICHVVKEAVRDGRLLLVETGLGSPCINFSRIHSRLSKVSEETDLIILEGPYKTYFSSAKTSFRCNCLRIGTNTFFQNTYKADNPDIELIFSFK